MSCKFLAEEHLAQAVPRAASLNAAPLAWLGVLPQVLGSPLPRFGPPLPFPWEAESAGVHADTRHPSADVVASPLPCRGLAPWSDRQTISGTGRRRRRRRACPITTRCPGGRPPSLFCFSEDAEKNEETRVTRPSLSSDSSCRGSRLGVTGLLDPTRVQAAVRIRMYVLLTNKFSAFVHAGVGIARALCRQQRHHSGVTFMAGKLRQNDGRRLSTSG